MIISHKHKFVYVRAKKVAGTSTEALISKFLEESGYDTTDVITPILEGTNLGEASSWNYRYEQNSANFENHSPPKHIKNRMGEDTYNSYFKFMNVRNPYDRVVSLYWNRIKDPYIHSAPSHARSFKKFVTQRGHRRLTALHPWAVQVDDFIRFENLEADVNRILSKWFDINKFNLPKFKTQYRTDTRHYRDYYDDKTKEIVRAQYQKDLDYFGYEF
jgi:hypothetical protein